MAPPAAATARSGAAGGRGSRPPGGLLRRLIYHLSIFWKAERLQGWAAPYRRRRGIVAVLVRQLEALLLALRHAFRQDILGQAGSLTYNSLLGLVPLLAVAFALFQAFGGLQRFRAPLNKFILENLAAGSAEQVGHWLDRFVGNINAGAIAGVSVIFLFWSAVGLLTTVESALNRIWGVQRGRPMLTKVIMYWGIITLTPPLLAISLSITARLRTASLTTQVLGVLPFGLGGFVLSVAAAVSISLAFFLIYLIVPNTKVRLVPAMIGGLVAGVIWSLLKKLFVDVVSGSMSASPVYGALGILPFLMIWLWVSWIVILFGATLTAANQSLHTEGMEAQLAMSQGFRERLAARICVGVAEAFQHGEQAPTVEHLAARVGTMSAVVRRIVDVLVAHGVLAETNLEKGEHGYLPGRDIEELRLSEVVEVLRQEDGNALELAGEPVGSQAVEALERAEEAGREVLDRVSLRDLARASRPLGSEGG